MIKIKNIYNLRYRPHVVILGAGASIAAIPDGDKNGLKTSVMKGFLERLGMSDIVAKLNLLTTSDNLEDIYSEMIQDEKYRDVTRELERRIYDYFSSFVIPDKPTIYDYLLLSLTNKDLVATFNWDPLLLQAFQRVRKITINLPRITFLHGNVAYGQCIGKHEEFVGGIKGDNCSICGEKLEPSGLLYPVANKNYAQNQAIKNNWETTKNYVNDAAMITVFGYSAPKTDTEAINLLQNAWGEKKQRDLEEVSIIDIIEKETIIAKWDDFIFTHHHNITNNFFDSYLGMFPRRSTEAVFDMHFKVLFHEDNKGFRPGMSFDELRESVKSLVVDEQRRSSANLTNPYVVGFDKW